MGQFPESVSLLSAKAFMTFVLFGGSIYFERGARGRRNRGGGVVGDWRGLPS